MQARPIQIFLQLQPFSHDLFSEATAKYYVFEVIQVIIIIIFLVSHFELNLVVLPLGYAFVLASGSEKVR